MDAYNVEGSTFSRENKEVRYNRDKWLAEVVAYDPIEFEKTLRNQKSC